VLEVTGTLSESEKKTTYFHSMCVQGKICSQVSRFSPCKHPELDSQASSANSARAR